MLTYILKRILIFIPTLLVISLVTFTISINAPGDPVDTMLNKGSGGGEGQSSEKIAGEKAYTNLRHQLGFDLPLFYFSFTNATYPDTLYKFPKANHRSTLERLSFTYGKWDNVSEYYHRIRKLEFVLFDHPKTEENADALNRAKGYVATLYDNYDEKKIETVISNLDFIFSETPTFMNIIGHYNSLVTAYHEMIHKQNKNRKYIPKLIFYGIKNQYHNWMFGDKPWLSSLPWVDDSQVEYTCKGFVRGDFGTSYQDKRPVSTVIWDALSWTMGLSLASIVLAYLIAIPLGVKSAIDKGKTSERIITTVLFMLYSLPVFWIGTILIIYLCGGDYLSWFPSPGAEPIPDDAPFGYVFSETLYRMALPLFCWTYASLAFLSRQMRGGMLNIIGQDYIRTARAKGLDEKTVIWKHGFRNSLIPMVTMFANIFPAVISGAFTIEYLFSIPGMGKVSYEAIVARNYPIIFTTLLFTAILTLIGNLVADIMYAVVDPRISFSKKK
ncbi:MAG: ABC transporter permease [Bacteroidetes bacterium]|nr:ABC transporter permease [Bacteroidota bacterium]